MPDEAAFCDECGSRVEQYKKTMPDRKAQTRMERKPQKKAKKKSFLGFIFKLLFASSQELFSLSQQIIFEAISDK